MKLSAQVLWYISFIISYGSILKKIQYDRHFQDGGKGMNFESSNFSYDMYWSFSSVSDESYLLNMLNLSLHRKSKHV
jgi:hypothetical protein